MAASVRWQCVVCRIVELVMQGDNGVGVGEVLSGEDGHRSRIARS